MTDYNKIITTVNSITSDYEFVPDLNNCIVIDTSQNRIGINTITPDENIHVSGGTIKTEDLFVLSKLTTKDIEVQGNLTIEGTTTTQNTTSVNTISAETININGVFTHSKYNFDTDGNLTTDGNITIGDNLNELNQNSVAEIRGPYMMVIDPRTHDNSSGIVRIKGDLQVDGSTTTIHSTELAIEDKDIILAKNAGNKNIASGAGIIIGKKSDISISFLYQEDYFESSVDLSVNGNIKATGNITATGNVGIGTTSPGEKLEVNGNIKATGNLHKLESTHEQYSVVITKDNHNLLRLAGSKGAGLIIHGHATSSNAYGGSLAITGAQVNQGGNGPFAEFLGSRSTYAQLASGTHTAVADGDVLGYFRWMGDDGTDVRNFAADIACEVDGTVAENKVPGAIKFRTHSGVNFTEKMRLSATGNLGIGTENPTAKLDVSGNINATGNIEANKNVSGSTSYFGKAAIGQAGTHASNAGFSHIDHAVGTTGHALQQDVDGNTYLNAQTDEYIRFDIGGQPKMMLDNTGNFGIGTTDPVCKLDVSGAIHLRGETIENQSKPDVDNRTNTYISFGEAGTDDDFAYLRQIGTTYNSFNLALDFHDDGSDAGFVIRDVHSTQTPDEIHTRFKVQRGGNVGIGTDNPDYKLDVDGDIRAIGDISAAGNIKANGATSSFGLASIGQVGGNSNYAGFSHINNSSYALLNNSDGETSLNAKSGKPIHFRINNTTKMYLDENGKLGIGTTSPSSKLEVYGATKLDGVLWTTGNVGIATQSSTDYKLNVGGNIYSAGIIRASSDITTVDGKVGIGTTAPSQKLDIRNGNLHITNGDINVEGKIFTTDFVGIGTNNPQRTLHVNGAIQTGTDTTAGEIEWYSKNSGDPNNYSGEQHWVFKMGPNAVGNRNLHIFYGTDQLLERGFFSNAQDVQQITFTGQHRSKFEGEFTNELVGLIVESTGHYIELNGSIAPKIDEALPCVKLTSSARSKRVYGVLSNIEGESRESTGGLFITVYPKEDGINRVFVNSLGEGSLWVINTYNLENGDYVCSSNVPGYGERQDDDLLHSYTVAKITMDLDWSNLPEWLETRKVTANGTISDTGEFTAAFVGVTYHCG